jgi:hypothetical protein
MERSSDSPKNLILEYLNRETVIIHFRELQ